MGIHLMIEYKSFNNILYLAENDKSNLPTASRGHLGPWKDVTVNFFYKNVNACLSGIFDLV